MSTTHIHTLSVTGFWTRSRGVGGVLQISHPLKPEALHDLVDEMITKENPGEDVDNSDHPYDEFLIQDDQGRAARFYVENGKWSDDSAPEIVALFDTPEPVERIKAQYYVVGVYGDVEPSMHAGPYTKVIERDQAARELGKNRRKALDDGGIYWLDTWIGQDGFPKSEIGAYSGGFMSGEFEFPSN